MAGINNYRQVAELLDYWNGRNIQRKPNTVLKCPDAPLTENNLVVTFRQQVVGSHQPLGESQVIPQIYLSAIAPYRYLG
jgi:hypothetical protein